MLELKCKKKGLRSCTGRFSILYSESLIFPYNFHRSYFSILSNAYVSPITLFCQLTYCWGYRGAAGSIFSTKPWTMRFNPFIDPTFLSRILSLVVNVLALLCFKSSCRSFVLLLDRNSWTQDAGNWKPLHATEFKRHVVIKFSSPVSSISRPQGFTRKLWGFSNHPCWTGNIFFHATWYPFIPHSLLFFLHVAQQFGARQKWGLERI